MMDQFIRQKARDVFELRYEETLDPDKNRWELCSRVLARKDVIEKVSPRLSSLFFQWLTEVRDVCAG